MDSQMVELAGRHWLTSQLLRADLEVALPERDRGIDLIVYADLDEQMGDFVAWRHVQESRRTLQSSFGFGRPRKRRPRILRRSRLNVPALRQYDSPGVRTHSEPYG